MSNMPRKPRIWYPGAIYHVVCRGNRKSDIFRDREDYQVYLEILCKAKREYFFKLYTYCLMTNHVHLHIETGDVDISKIMKKINMLYAIYFNQKHDISGHLFQGRFNSQIIEKDGYNLEVNKYIHLNPVRANMVLNPADYHWSSYNIYLGKTFSDLVETDKILSYFPGNSVHQYIKFITSETNYSQKGSDPR
ncbi:REP element-mobilizing transposase RayT [Desulforamulus putei DSM 12395]|uniref:REP element-mobilizing transposase RayT n=2 Tax=Desulforamulus putei TaxID=74701 RepID=A0A1M4VCV0_9FIRM|nr:REP element-mobilizing transposase RayT [Desulforamulus putei DSM 12395]